MTDAFDTFAKHQFKKNWDNLKPAEKKPEPIAGWARAMEKLFKGAWVSFIHPKAGKVAGRCTGCKFSGYSEPGHIPDFSLEIEGRSKTQRNTITVSMVDSRAMMHDTEEQAVAETKTQ